MCNNKWPFYTGSRKFLFNQCLISVSLAQGCGNTMPHLSDLVPFHSGQVENYYLLVLGQVQMYKSNKILYYIFWLVIMSSHVALKTVWILISWLLKKPANLDLKCSQENWYLVSYCFQKCILFKHRKVYGILLICTIGQVKTIFGQVHYGHLLVPGQVENFTISTPLVLPVFYR